MDLYIRSSRITNAPSLVLKHWLVNENKADNSCLKHFLSAVLHLYIMSSRAQQQQSSSRAQQKQMPAKLQCTQHSQTCQMERQAEECLVYIAMLLPGQTEVASSLLPSWGSLLIHWLRGVLLLWRIGLLWVALLLKPLWRVALLRVPCNSEAKLSC